MLNKTSGFAVFFRQQEFYLSETNMPMDGLIAALDYISGGKFYTLVYLDGGEWKKFDLDAKSCKLLLLLINLPPSHGGDAAGT